MKSLMLMQHNGLIISRLDGESVCFGRSWAGVPLARNPKMPKFAEVGRLLRILPGKSKQDIRALLRARYLESGSTGAPVSWRQPNSWISSRLDETESKIAWAIWEESEYSVNPARIYGSYLLINRFALLSVLNGVYVSSPKTEAFLGGNPKVLFEVDYFEGIYHILSWIASRREVERGDVLDAWMMLCRSETRMTSVGSIVRSLYTRISNVKERKLVYEKSGLLTATDEALSYLQRLECFHRFAA